MRKTGDKTGVKVALGIFLVLIFLLILAVRLVNTPAVQSKIYANINRVSDLKIQSADLMIDLFKREIGVKNLGLFNPKKNQLFRVDDLKMNFRILPLLRGLLRISSLEAGTLTIDVKKPDDTVKIKKPHISFTTLLLFQNVRIDSGHVKNVSVTFPKSTIAINEFNIKYIPTFLGDIDLMVAVDSANAASAKGEKVSISKITVKGSTNVEDWSDIFPYINNIDGIIAADNISWRKIELSKFETDIDYNGGKLNLKKLRSLLNGNVIDINGHADINKEEYALNLAIPEPIYLPHLAGESSFMDTSGYISGSVNVTGKGFDYKTTVGKAKIEAHHKLGEKNPLPADLKADVDISNGTIRTTDVLLEVGGNKVDVTCELDYLKPYLTLKFSGENVPIESVMNRFYNKHYHPAAGIGSAKGELTGWKPDLKFNLDVLAKGSYYNIKAEEIEMNLQMTYTTLKMTASVNQEGRHAGVVELNMKMGDKLPDGTRYKTFDFSAALDNCKLENPMFDYDLTGTASGEMKLAGKPLDFTGSGTVTINNGSFKQIGFSAVKSEIDFLPKKITLKNMEIATSETNPAKFPNPIIMDVTDTGTRFHGQPREGIDIDADYITASSSWKIAKISYRSESHPEWKSELKGTVSGDGKIDLSIDGTFDAELLNYLRGYFRSAGGPVELKNLKLTGTTANVSATGVITLLENDLQLRNWGYFFDRITGDIILKGHTATAENLRGRIEYGDFSLTGNFQHENNLPSSIDAAFRGKSIMYSTEDRAFRAEADCDLQFKGSPNSSLLSGNINILDGRYSKNFSIFDKLKQGYTYDTSSATESKWKNMRLDLKIKDTGDLKIDNNIGVIWLGSDIQVTGTTEKPQVNGNIESLGGEIHYAGIKFDVVRGYIEFRDPYTIPYVEFTGAKEVGDYNVTLNVRGRTDKLYLDLTSTPPLEKRDILALLAFGMTEKDREKTQLNYNLGTGLVAEQFGSLLQGPVTKYTPIDRFRVETATNFQGDSVTRLYMGKDISDRLKVYFITDINAEDSEQVYEAEYMLTDFMLLKGSKLSNNAYRFHISFRFRE